MEQQTSWNLNMGFGGLTPFTDGGQADPRGGAYQFAIKSTSFKESAKGGSVELQLELAENGPSLDDPEVKVGQGNTYRVYMAVPSDKHKDKGVIARRRWLALLLAMGFSMQQLTSAESQNIGPNLFQGRTLRGVLWPGDEKTYPTVGFVSLDDWATYREDPTKMPARPSGNERRQNSDKAVNLAGGAPQGGNAVDLAAQLGGGGLGDINQNGTAPAPSGGGLSALKIDMPSI